MNHERMRNVLGDVYSERLRQERLKAEGRFEFTCADSGLTDAEKATVLGEEFGEVCRAVLERGKLVTDTHGADLRKELIEVAAVAVAWAESIEVPT